MLERVDFDLGVYAPTDLSLDGLNIPPKVLILWSDYPEYDFTIAHNRINANRRPRQDVIGNRCRIHPSSVVFEGTHVGVGPGEVKVQIKHMGNVIFGDDVDIGALCLIERGIFDSTIIGNGAKIDGLCTIGHNSVIGENLITAPGSHIGGSCLIGKNCWLGQNSTVKAGTKICDHVILGCGSVIVADITEPGIYAGVPAMFKKPYQEGWKF
jgi:UDP-3-O-[3-hydroxymyristoyl] glucosamine N-acyltransferase